ncbi:unnamed protein product [Cladocopium goreaui]|uniref:Uncharacterized protein n=1 Tax=Cladocopium goreaui TaxID=2562237 RepID=A0A9P1FJF8_9DINO|nr:unnamed protein product [Cladocopium goreaui]
MDSLANGNKASPKVTDADKRVHECSRSQEAVAGQLTEPVVGGSANQGLQPWPARSFVDVLTLCNCFAGNTALYEEDAAAEGVQAMPTSTGPLRSITAGLVSHLILFLTVLVQPPNATRACTTFHMAGIMSRIR